MVAQYSQVPQQVKPPGPPLKNAASLKGKSVWLVTLGTNIPYFAAVANGMQGAASAAGVSLHVCDGQLSPSTISSCLNQAVSAGAAGVIGDGFAIPFAQAAVNNVVAHHIPYVEADHEQGGGNDRIAYLGNNSYLQSELAADWIIANSKGKADVLVAENIEDPVTSSFLTQGGLPQFSSDCPACKIKVIHTTAEQLNNLPSAVGTSLVQDPNIDYVFPEFDEDVSAAMQGITQTHHSTNIQVASATGLLPDLELIKKGQIQAADAGCNTNFFAWASLDDIMRMMLKMPPTDNENIPVRLFTKANVGGLALSGAAFQSGAWYGNTAFEQMFEKLWRS